MASDHEAKIHRDRDGVPVYVGRWAWIIEYSRDDAPPFRVVSGRIHSVERSTLFGRSVVLVRVRDYSSVARGGAVIERLAYLGEILATRESADAVLMRAIATEGGE